MVLMSQFCLQIGCNECVRDYMKHVLSNFFNPVFIQNKLNGVL